MPAPRSAISSARSPAFGGEVLWKPVDQNWGARRRAQLRLAARLRGPRLRLLRLRRGDRAAPRSTGTPAGRASRRSSTPGATSPATGAARFTVPRRFANGWAVGAFATKTDVTDRGLRRGQLRQGHPLDHPAALGDAVRDPADDQRRPALARQRRRRLAQHREPALPDRARPRPRPARAELGSVLAMKRTLAAPRASRRSPAAAAAGATRSSQRGDGGVGRLLAATEPEPAAEPAQPITRADDRAGRTPRRSGRGSSATRRRRCCTPPAANGGYVTYISPLRQTVTLRGPQVTGTRGLGTDLLSAWSSRPTRWRGRSRRAAGRRG